ncbi:nucleotidyltransferase domain-containing protein [Methylobacterium sp. J-077]|uniref:GSU2403 family nucleotidyltransferase fold protein n=1 Tax=Methylobacterium sp. J-077 TaxID=2836656 RepID=UPI001FBB31FD|nr:nucleotidyltransferase domain-containing protein [Methylobacterium sp. J-077]MCJ2121081.1 nucleotidyltransferase domain-containing protein [Methylobacterium sp. J-077]
MPYRELDDEQARQLINAEQVFDAYRAAQSTLQSRFAGSMAWKSVEGRSYLYRFKRGVWKSLGPRSEETEAIHQRFVDGRSHAKMRSASLAQRLNTIAAVNRALRLGRMPVMAARILRALSDARLTEPVVATVGTNALFAYERMAGVQIDQTVLETADFDLLYDARASLKLIVPEVAASGIVGLLRKVDHSFEVMGKRGFRAANRDGYIVDLITPAPKDPIRPSEVRQIGRDPDDLVAVEIFGLAWLVNSPKVRATVLDLRGYPAEMIVPDPRAFALHKAWLSERPDRNPEKRRRDAAQAKLIAGLIARYLPHLGFDDPVLGALPKALRDQAATLTPAVTGRETNDALEPDW